MKRFRVKNNRNAAALDQTLQALKPGEHKLVREPDGRVTEFPPGVDTPETPGYFIVESSDPDFCKFACKAQGYAEPFEERE